MSEKDETIKLGFYINLILKQRWLLIISLCLALTVGIYLALNLPRTYEASTLILVEPQSVPSNFVREIVSTDIDARIATIQQQILSRTNLENVINKFNLFTEIGFENMFMEDKVASIRNRVLVNVTRANRGPNTFSISFQDSNPETAMNIVNGLATLFIDENLKIREAQASGTSDFLDDELQVMRDRLVAVEEKLRAYRARYRGELPEQLDGNLRILDNLQMQLSEREERLSDEKNRLIEIENQIQARQELLTTKIAAESVSDDKKTLDQLKNELADLETKYTPKHPDIVRLKSKIVSLEAKYKNEELQSSHLHGSDSSEIQSRFLDDKTLSDQIKQRAKIMISLKDIADDITKIKSQIIIYQQRVERTPKREEELLALNRDYKNNKDSYSSLLNRKLEAEIAFNMEKKQKGEQFRIIDPATLPKKPISPDLKRLFMIILAAGFGIGAGLIFVLDFFNSSFKNPDDFEEDLGLAVLATIPKVYQKKDFRLKRLNQVLTAVSIMVVVSLMVGFALLVFNGVEPTMEIVRPYVAFLKI